MHTEGVPRAHRRVRRCAPPPNAPAPAAWGTPRRLPLQPARLIGRDSDVQAVLGILRRPDVRLLTLSGTGGTGKTRLAIEVAACLDGEFADGAVFVDLAALRDATLVTSAICRALGVDQSRYQPPLETLLRYLHDRQPLLVLDNFEQVLPAAADVAALLAECRAVKVLVTSRAPLHVRWEHEYPVAPLEVRRPPRTRDRDRRAGRGGGDEIGPAPALFVDRVRAIRPDFALTADNAAAIEELCARLDGLPLAIELAAARTRLLPPEAMLRRLQHRLDLTRDAGRDLPGRQRSLRAAIDWSYDLLPPAAQALFPRLAVFAGGWTLDAAETVGSPPSEPDGLDAITAGAARRTANPARDGDGGQPLGDVLDALGALVDGNLVLAEVRGGEVRYRLLETIREYAAERLEASGEADITRRRHAKYFVAQVETADVQLYRGEQGSLLDRLETEHDNLRAALAWLIGRGEAEAAQRLSGVLWRFWAARGHVDEGRARLAAALALRGAPDAPPSAAVRAKALYAAARLAWYQGDGGATLALCEESLAIFRRLDSPIGIAFDLFILGWVRDASGDRDGAQAALDAARAIFEKVGSRHGRAYALLGLGRVALNSGDGGAARAFLRESLTLFRELGDRSGTSAALSNLGILAQMDHDYGAARALHEETVAIRRSLGETADLATSLTDLGVAVAALGDASAARPLFEESLSLHRVVGNKSGVAAALEGYAGLAARGQPERALLLAGTAARLREEIGRPLAPAAHAALDTALAPARDALGSRAGVAWAEGRTMPLEEAVAFALAPEDAAPAGPSRVGRRRLPGGLTARQAEVLRLIAAGGTDREIAAALVLSHHTVGRHVATILAKLGLPTRAAAAAFAQREGIV